MCVFADTSTRSCSDAGILLISLVASRPATGDYSIPRRPRRRATGYRLGRIRAAADARRGRKHRWSFDKRACSTSAELTPFPGDTRARPRAPGPRRRSPRPGPAPSRAARLPLGRPRRAPRLRPGRAVRDPLLPALASVRRLWPLPPLARRAPSRMPSASVRAPSSSRRASLFGLYDRRFALLQPGLQLSRDLTDPVLGEPLADQLQVPVDLTGVIAPPHVSKMPLHHVQGARFPAMRHPPKGTTPTAPAPAGTAGRRPGGPRPHVDIGCSPRVSRRSLRRRNSSGSSSASGSSPTMRRCRRLSAGSGARSPWGVVDLPLAQSDA